MSPVDPKARRANSSCDKRCQQLLIFGTCADATRDLDPGILLSIDAGTLESGGRFC